MLNAIIWLPIFVGILLVYLKNHDIYNSAAKYLTAITTLIVLFYNYKIFASFDNSIGKFQHGVYYAWMPSLGISYSLGIDGISLPLVLLTNFSSALVIFYLCFNGIKHINQQLGLFLMLQGMMNGVFLATDSILFYVFFEAMMLPMFVIIGVFGGGNRKYATIKFILYTFVGSLFFLTALFYIHNVASLLGRGGPNSFLINNFYGLDISLTTQKILFIGLLLGFAVKVPMWPFHTWLPDAHTEAPTPGSVILAAITLKMGGYGILRFVLPIVPQGAMYFSHLIIYLSLIAVVYIGFVAIAQSDMKKLIAYSSVSHMGFVTLGIFVIFDLLKQSNNVANLTPSLSAAMLQMISHGFVSGALFFCIGMLYKRTQSREINDYGGVANTMPYFASFFLLFCMANSALPGTSSFVGEFIIILKCFQANFWYAFFAGATLLLAAGYTLWMYKRVAFGPCDKQSMQLLKDITAPEVLILVVLAFCVIFFGVYPKPIVSMMDASMQQLVQTILASI